jgi:hypothetical protein
MTPLIVFLAVLAVAIGATVAYGYRYRSTNLYLSAGLAQLCWGWAALHGGDVVVRTDFYVDSVGQPALQYVAAAMFVVSALVFMLAHFDVYPPGKAVRETQAGQ